MLEKIPQMMTSTELFLSHLLGHVHKGVAQYELMPLDFAICFTPRTLLSLRINQWFHYRLKIK